MKKLLIFIFSLVLANHYLQAQTYTLENRFLIDVGQSNGTTISPTNSNYWNTLESTAVGTTEGLTDTLGRSSSYTVSIASGSSFINGANGTPTDITSAELGDLAVASATGDYFFVSGSSTKGTFIFEGLNEDAFYEFRIFGSRAQFDRTSQFTFTGSTTTVRTLNTQDNRENLASSGIISSDAQGEISLELVQADGGFAYINLIEIREYSKYMLDKSFFVDFSLTGSIDPITASPDANGNHWNNLKSITTSTYTAPLTMLDQEGSTVDDFTISFKDFANSGSSNGGQTNLGANMALSDLNITSATTDYFFVSGSTQGSLLIEGLDVNKAYRFDIFGYRATATSRITTYQVKGSNAVAPINTLVSNNNTTDFFTSDYVYPNASGEIEILVGHDNTSFGYINLLRMSQFTPMVEVEDISVTGNDITEPVGTSTLVATIAPANATNTEVTWSVDDESIAYIDDQGVLYPKNNGSVVVTATSVADPSISGTHTINISNQILDFYVYGTAIEGQPDGSSTDNAIRMLQMPGENGILTGKFTTYSLMDGDNSKSFQFFDNTSGNPVQYGVNAGQILQGGFPIGISTNWTGPVRIRVEFSGATGSYEVLWDYQVTLRGNGLPNGFGGPGVALTYQSDGTWSGTADFTNTPADGGPLRFYVVTFDNYGNYREFWKLDDTPNSLVGKFPDETGGQSYSTIAVNDDIYNVTIDLQEQTYSVKNQTITENGIAFMGSSVADGFGAIDSKGYAFKYDSLLEKRFADMESSIEWTTTNISVGGNTTADVKLRFYDDLLPTGMSYVLYGLALGNEGIISATDKQAVVDTYLGGLEDLIAMAEDYDIVPIVANNYPNGNYNDEYPFIIDANIQMAQWDVPTINFLGALDDGTGQWVDAFEADPQHPNTSGYNEMLYAIVPSLFDALADGKAQPVKYANTEVTMDGLMTDRSFSFEPDGTLHSFTLSTKVKTAGSGQILKLDQGNNQATISIDAADGTVDYAGPTSTTIDGTVAVNDNTWHTITLTHYYAAERTILYIDGVADGEVSEQLVIDKVNLHDENTTDATSYSNLMFYRAGMTPAEIALIADDTKLLKSSMEVYAPLDGSGNSLPLLANIAQSTVEVSLDGQSADARLSDLTVAGETITDFDANTLVYEVELPFGTVDAPLVDAVTNSQVATYEVNAADELPGATTVVVTAENTAITSTYTINWTIAAPSTDATLSDLLIDNATIIGFDPNILSYDVELPAGTQQAPTVTAKENDDNATVLITPPASLPGTTTILVTAQDGSTKTYEINFTVYVNVESIAVTGADIDVPIGTSTMVATVLPVTANDPSVTWSVDDESIAYIDDQGVLYPKNNGTVEVTATSVDNPTVSGSFTINISNQITALFTYGTAIEGEPSALEAIEMQQLPGENGVLTGIFTTYTAMDGDPSKSFQFTALHNGTNEQYGVITANQIGQGGFPIGISPDWTGPVRLRVDFTQAQATYEVVWDYQVFVKGNGTQGAWGGTGVELDYAGNGAWSGEVDFTFTDNPGDATNFRYLIITFDNYGNYREFRKVETSTNEIAMFFPDESGGQGLSEVSLAQGIYNITIDLQNQTFSHAPLATDEYGIAFMGSSVAAGFPIPTVNAPYEGYAFKYDSLLEERFGDGRSTIDWNTTNISIGGNNTDDVIHRFEEDLMPLGASYVWYGLAVANQGIIGATDKQAIVDSYLSGLETLIDMAEAENIDPVVANNYPNGLYDDEYAFVIDANIEMAQWDVPTVNFLGALDDGTGKWVDGYWIDSAHPNLAGYNEMFYSIVPSLFDALAEGKPQPVKYANTSMAMNDVYFGRQLTFSPDEKVHSFTTSIKVNTIGSGEVLNFETAGNNAVLAIASDGTVDYTGPGAASIDGASIVNDGNWHTITLTHYYAAERTILYIDGVAENETAEQLEIAKVLVHEENTTDAIQYSNLLFYRSGMTPEEIALVADDTKLLKSSLEVYAPLDGSENTLPVLTNLAQSTVELSLEGESADARLASITINGNALQNFDASKLDYTVNLPFGTTSAPQVAATASDAAASVDITQATGTNGEATIIVTAENTNFTKTYTIDFNVNNPSANADLFQVRLDGEVLDGFISTTNSYNIELPLGTEEAPTVTAFASDGNAVVEINQPQSLPGAATIVVIAENKTTINFYTINFTVEQGLTAIILNGADITTPLGTTQMNVQTIPGDFEDQSVIWSVNDPSIAHIDDNGKIYPKKNGTVIVTAESVANPEIAASYSISISNQITNFYAFGNGLEGEPGGTSTIDAISLMQMPGENGVLTGIFTGYTFLDGDPAKSFQFFTMENNAPQYYGVQSANIIAEGGAAIGLSPDWVGPARIRVDFTGDNPTYEIVWDYKVVVRGNGTEGAWSGDGDTLTYQANGVWAGEVDFTFADNPNDAANFRYLIVTSDNYGNYREFRKIANSSNSIAMHFPDESGGQELTPINLAQGVYNITIDLQNQQYFHRNAEETEFGIAFMGSSVAAGFPVPTASGPFEGWAFKYDSLLQVRFEEEASSIDWNTTNISIGGNTTADVINRFESDLLATGMPYVMYGLALGNEGILSAADKQVTVDTYLNGMETLIEKAQTFDIVPVATNNYPNGFYDDEYEYVINANIEMAQWDIPTVNFLGALDDGTGKWVTDYQARLGNGNLDNAHPNRAGYHEMFLTIVPSLFDALAAGKSNPIKYNNTSVTMDGIYQDRGISFSPDGTVHSFTLSFEVNTDGAGQLAEVQTRSGAIDLSINAGGQLVYNGANGNVITGPSANNAQWHTITLTHYYAAQRTLLYVNGNMVGEVSEQLQPETVTLHSAGLSDNTSYSNLLFYRAGMTPQEIAWIADEETLLKSSLEVYAPLDGSEAELPVDANIALSLVEIQLTGASADTRLGHIEVDGEKLPGFDASSLNYTFGWPKDNEELPLVEAIARDANATVTVVQAAAVPGIATITVVAETGESQVYTITFEAIDFNGDLSLAELLVDGASVGGFNAATLDYDILLPAGTPLIPTVTGIATDPAATVEYVIPPRLPGTTQVIVSAPGTNETTTYTVNFGILGADEDASLAGLFVNGEPVADFDVNQYEYSFELPFAATSQPFVTAVTNNNSATLTVKQATEIPGTAIVTVRAENYVGKRSYKVHFTRADPDGNTALTDILVNGESVDLELNGSDQFSLEWNRIGLPEIDAVAESNLSTVAVDMPESLPGVAVITIAAQDGSSQTYEIEIIRGVITSIDDDLRNQIKVYPNPVIEYLQVEVPQLRDYGLYNLNGMLIDRADVRLTNGQIDMSQLAHGVYILKITFGKDQVADFRIIKQ